MKRFLLVLTLGLLSFGCGKREQVPETFHSSQDADRARAIQDAQFTVGDGIEKQLWKTAQEDKNEFLRARALEQLYTQTNKTSPDGLPEGAAAALQRAILEDPDLNRRYAVLLQLRYQTVTAREDLFQVAATTRNPQTRKQLLIAAAKKFSPQELTGMAESSRSEESRFGTDALEVQKKIQAGYPY